jgi:hypothetical protein
MPRSKDVEGYEDKNYKQKKEIYASLTQVFSDLQYDHNSHSGWNMLSDKVKGVTMKLTTPPLGENMLELTFHRYEVTTVEGLARLEDDGKKFLTEVVKDLKKRFKKHTGKALKLTKLEEGDPIYDKISRLESDTSWMLGSNRYGYGARPVGRYLIRNTVVYRYDAEALG